MDDFDLTAFDEFAPSERTISDPVRVERRLQELSPDLTADLLLGAIMGGLGARNETTQASAPTAGGLKQWLETVEVIRRELSTHGWKIHNRKNCPFITSQDRAVSIVVMTGDSETGRIGVSDPTNAAEKGSVAEGYVNVNMQLELFNEAAVRFAERNSKGTQVLAFLYHYDRKLNEVRFELSCPIAFNGKQITKWGERLIFGSVPNSPHDQVDIAPKPIAPANVEVEPKTGTFE